MLRLVEVLGISDGAIICSNRHDASSYKLLLPLVFGDSSPTKDGGNNLGGVLVGGALVLALFSALIVFGLIVVTHGFFDDSPPIIVFRPLHSRMVCLASLRIGHRPSSSLPMSTS